MKEYRNGMKNIRSNEQLCAMIRKGNEEARELLIRKNERLVAKYAARFLRIFRNDLDFEDLMQVGYLGLMEAADRFEPSMGNSFTTYAVYWIRQAIGREIANSGSRIRIPVHMYEKVGKLTRLERDCEIFEIPEEERMAYITGEMELKEEQVEELRVIREYILTTSSLNCYVGDDAETELITLIEDRTEPTVEEMMETEADREMVYELLSKLSAREQYILRRRFGLDGMGTHTLEAVGSELQVTRERIRQIEAKALRKLRFMANRNPAVAAALAA